MAQVEFPARTERSRTCPTLVGVIATTVTLMAPELAGATSVPSTPVQLLSGSLQPVIDQLIEAQHQVEADTAGFSFVRQQDLGPMLHEYSQNLASTMLAS